MPSGEPPPGPAAGGEELTAVVAAVSDADDELEPVVADDEDAALLAVPDVVKLATPVATSVLSGGGGTVFPAPEAAVGGAQEALVVTEPLDEVAALSVADEVDPDERELSEVAADDVCDPGLLVLEPAAASVAEPALVLEVSLLPALVIDAALLPVMAAILAALLLVLAAPEADELLLTLAAALETAEPALPALEAAELPLVLAVPLAVLWQAARPRLNTIAAAIGAIPRLVALTVRCSYLLLDIPSCVRPAASRRPASGVPFSDAGAEVRSQSLCQRLTACAPSPWPGRLGTA